MRRGKTKGRAACKIPIDDLDAEVGGDLTTDNPRREGSADRICAKNTGIDMKDCHQDDLAVKLGRDGYDTRDRLQGLARRHYLPQPVLFQIAAKFWRYPSTLSIHGWRDAADRSSRPILDVAVR